MPEPGPLAAHLHDAIRLNRARRAGYRQRGGLRAEALSRALVGAERALLPLAHRIDREAARVGLDLSAALADMAEAPSAAAPVPDGPHDALEAHVLDSAARFAEVGADAERQSNGEAARLGRWLVRGHRLLVPFARALDRLAAPVHARGVGLFVNDLPPIPTAR